MIALLLFALTFKPELSHSRNKLNFGASYITDSYSLSKNTEARRDFLLGSFLFDTELHYKNSRLTISFLGAHSNGSPTDEYLNDVQIFSNIDVQGQEGLKVYELNYRYNFNDRGFFQLGWTDLSNRLNTLTPGSALLNSSFGTNGVLGNTGFFGPSIFPIPSFGLQIDFKLGENNYLRASLNDPIVPENFREKEIQTDVRLNSDNLFSILEIGSEKKDQYKVALGLWTLAVDSTLLNDFNQSALYFQFAYKVNRFFYPFVRYERASKVQDRIYSNLSLGSRVGLPSLKSQFLEIGFSTVRVSGRPLSEDVFELLYQRSLIEYLSLSLGYQNIGGLGGLSGSAHGFLVRLQARFDWTTRL